MTILKEITVSPIHVQTQEKRTMQELQYKFAVVQGLKWPLGFAEPELYGSLALLEDDDALDPFKLEVW